MELVVLGPPSVTTARGEVDIGGARQGRPLAVLLARAGRIVPPERLFDIVFEGAPPRSATTTACSSVAGLRRAAAAVLERWRSDACRELANGEWAPAEATRTNELTTDGRSC